MGRVGGNCVRYPSRDCCGVPRSTALPLSHPDRDARAAGQVIRAVSWIGDGNTVYARLGEASPCFEATLVDPDDLFADRRARLGDAEKSRRDYRHSSRPAETDHRPGHPHEISRVRKSWCHDRDTGGAPCRRRRRRGRGRGQEEKDASDHDGNAEPHEATLNNLSSSVSSAAASPPTRLARWISGPLIEIPAVGFAVVASAMPPVVVVDDLCEFGEVNEQRLVRGMVGAVAVQHPPRCRRLHPVCGLLRDVGNARVDRGSGRRSVSCEDRTRVRRGTWREAAPRPRPGAAFVLSSASTPRARRTGPNGPSSSAGAGPAAPGSCRRRRS
jgi:hypothetical protein